MDNEKNSNVNRRELLRTSDRQVGLNDIHTPDDNSRRGFLGRSLTTVTGAVLGLFGFSKPILANQSSRLPRAQVAAREYASSTKLQTVLRRHATDLLEGLSNDGYIESASLERFPVEPLHKSVKSFVDAQAGAFITATMRSGTPNVKVYVKRQLSDDSELRLVVEPATGKTHATIIPPDGDYEEATEFITNSSGGVTTTSDCNCDSKNKCGTVCGWYSCEDCAKIKVKFTCSDFSCEGCELIDYSCCGSYEC